MEVGAFGVFDGHGGAAASAYVRDNLFKNILKHDLFNTDLKAAVEQSYTETDAAYLKHDEKHKNDDGTTAVTAVVCHDQLVVAHVGDSRAVMGHNQEVIEMTDDHKPNRADEKQRIQNVGGTVVFLGTWRVGGVLAVSRSFGNRTLKQFIVAHPEINEKTLDDTTQCLVMASDGVWDVVSNEAAIQVVLKYDNAQEAAEALVSRAYELGSADNISSLVVFFNL